MPLVEVAAVPQPLDEALHERLVLGVGRADEEVVRGREGPGQLAEPLGGLVGPRLGLEARSRGRLGDLGSMLVGAGEEEHVLPALARVARRRVGGDRRVRVAPGAAPR